MPTDEEDARRNAAIPGMNQKVGAPRSAGLGDAVSAGDPEIDSMMRVLRANMQGYDVWGRALSQDPATLSRLQREAANEYGRLREFADGQRAQREAEEQQRRDRAVAEERNRIEAERVRIAEGEIAGKLELEQQRIEIEKAKVVVDAMARIGADPEMRKQFGPMLEAMGQRLLAGTAIGVNDDDTRKLQLISTAAKPGGGS